MPGRKDLERALGVAAMVCVPLVLGPNGEIQNPPSKPCAQVCEDPALVFHYTESPCRQDPFCEDPSRPDTVDGPIYAQWWCKVVREVQHTCLWPASRGMFLTYASYYREWHERRGKYIPCDGEEDECILPKGWAYKLTQ